MTYEDLRERIATLEAHNSDLMDGRHSDLEKMREMKALIRELMAALEHNAEADQKLTNCWSAAEAFHWCNSRAEVALARAKQAGYGA